MTSEIGRDIIIYKYKWGEICIVQTDTPFIETTLKIASEGVTRMARRDFETDAYYFHSGTSNKAYEFMGAHREGDDFVFRVWAPNAEAAFVVGDFNGWSNRHPMRRATSAGIWEARICNTQIKVGDIYKYKFYNRGREIYKSDPYGYKMELPPNSPSVLCDIDDYEWHDAGWLAHRAATFGTDFYSQPMNIYEVHLGSWKRHDDGSYCTYKELADELAPYVKQMGYTHIELMPVAEHPFDGSWGYQVCGYYAPSARFGDPDGFMAFVDAMHTAGIGVILDWVPAHFPKDAFGLYEFDGQPLYEYQGADRMENKGWGTRCFDVGREEVQSFLISNAIYWIDKYHVDGLRVDAVSSMLYLDYCREEGEWVPNSLGDNRNLESIEFFKKLNGTIKEYYPDVLMIAEESSAWQNVTGFEGDGLGFDMKWNMGWMNDTLFYAEKEPIYRKYHHDKLTFSLMYAFKEKYVLPISHDEVVHGKKSFLDKMPGDYWRKFAGARVFEAYRMTHPGKKLSFMTNEIAQFREWAYEESIEWFMLDYEMHAKYQLYCSDLNNFYLSHPELWQKDCSWDGFQWIDADDADRSIISYRRIAANGKELIVVLNFTPANYEDYYLKVPQKGTYSEVFNSDNEKYGGSGVTNAAVKFESFEELGSEFIRLRMPPMAAVIFEKNADIETLEEKKPQKRTTRKKVVDSEKKKK